MQRCVLALTLALVLGGAAVADSLLYNDGRFYEVPKLEQGSDGNFIVRYEHGSIVVPADLVKEFFILQVGGEYTPRNEDEKEKVAKGLVPYEGRWIHSTHRDRLISEMNLKRKEAMAELKAHQIWRNRYKKSTKHFAFEYTVPDEVGETYMDMFEAFYGFAKKEWRISQGNTGKLKVCFYNNKRDFERIGNVPRGVLGYFKFVAPYELNVFYERRDEKLTLDVVFHEANHYIMRLFVKPKFTLPPWASEGLAEYYGASDWDPVTKKMTVGRLQEGRLINLTDEMDGGKMQSLRGLFGEVRVSAIQYAWSWSLHHMLLESKKYKNKYKKFVTTVARSNSVKREPWPGNPNYLWPVPTLATALFQRTLGIKDLDAFEQQWYDYIRSLKVESDRGYHRAGTFCIRYDRPVRACLYFKKALELGSKNPSTFEEYARVLIRRSKYTEAADVLTSGTKIDPLNPYFYYQMGQAHRRMDGEKNKELGQRYIDLAREMSPDDSRLAMDINISFDSGN